jgi:hypothetical protein
MGPSVVAYGFSRKDLAVLMRFASLSDPKFAEKIGEPEDATDLCIECVAEGAGPSKAILEYFGLRREGKAFEWIPR